MIVCLSTFYSLIKLHVFYKHKPYKHKPMHGPLDFFKDFHSNFHCLFWRVKILFFSYSPSLLLILSICLFPISWESLNKDVFFQQYHTVLCILLKNNRFIFRFEFLFWIFVLQRMIVQLWSKNYVKKSDGSGNGCPIKVTAWLICRKLMTSLEWR